jgi:hybrid cluster-associated redox disulfide protein
MKLTKDAGILDAVNEYPETVEVFTAYGMHCFGCMAARFENIEQGAIAHGIDVDALMKDLNEKISQ